MAEHPFRFRKTERLEEGVDRVVSAQVRIACQRLDTLDEQPDEAIHETRKHCKKLRGLARLVRDAIGEPDYRWANTRLRDTARIFSDARDAGVRLNTLDLLRSDDALPLGFERELGEIRTALERTRRLEVGRVAGNGIARESARLALEGVVRRSREWSVDTGAEGVRQGLRRTYGRGRRRFLEAVEDPSPEVFHEWRKRVKYLWYALRLLRPAWPRMFKARAKSLHDLSDFLGDANDLNELVETPGVLKGSDALPGASLVRQLARVKKHRLWERSIALGRRLYQEEADNFACRIAGPVAFWQAELEETCR